MKRAACDACGYVHAPDDTYAVGRFGHGPLAFRARFEGSPVRESRAAAESDLCEWRASQVEPETPVTTQTPARVAPSIVIREPVAPFPAATVETLARAKAWRDFLAQVSFSLQVWQVDPALAAEIDDPLTWLRSCSDDLTRLLRREPVGAPS